jgi:hypothetical protein
MAAVRVLRLARVDRHDPTRQHGKP